MLPLSGMSDKAALFPNIFSLVVRQKAMDISFPFKT